jgi:uncharacterized membrane protein YdjX (TVP38/TMEM64 family)
MVQRLVLLAALALALTAFFLSGLHHYLSLATVKARHLELAAAFARRPAPVVGAFMLLNVTVLTLSIPGAVLTMALAGGAIFGRLWGTLIVLTSLTIGDSLGFLLARYLLRDWVERRFGAHVPAIQRGIERDGAFYLLSLRLLAVVPFFVVNLTMGLTHMRLRTFAPVSFIGLAPATVLYVNAGTELARIRSLGDVLSPRLLLAFLLLALLPLALRLILRRQRS